MSTTVEIPGGTAVLRENKDLRVRHRRLIESASIAAAPVMAKMPSNLSDEELAKLPMSALTLTRQEADVLLDLQDATIVALLESWTLPVPIPTMETVGDMDPEVYDALALKTKSLGADVAKGADLGVNPDPKAPGTDSNSSDGPSRDEAEPTSPETSPSSTESSPSDS